MIMQTIFSLIWGICSFLRWTFYWLASSEFENRFHSFSFVFLQIEPFQMKISPEVVYSAGGWVAREEKRKFVHIVAKSIENLEKKSFQLKALKNGETFVRISLTNTTKWLYFDFRCLLKMIVSKSIWKFTFISLIFLNGFFPSASTTCLNLDGFIVVLYVHLNIWFVNYKMGRHSSKQIYGCGWKFWNENQMHVRSALIGICCYCHLRLIHNAAKHNETSNCFFR